MNIFFVSRGWPSTQEPQWGCFERDQALALASLGHNITVLSVDIRAGLKLRKLGITQKKENGISIYNLYSGPWGRILMIVSFGLYQKIIRKVFLVLLKHVIEREGVPDLLYTHYLGNSHMAIIGKWAYGIPIVGIEHFSSVGRDKIIKRNRKKVEETYKYLDALITVSSALQENIKKKFNIDSIVVHNMVGREFNYCICERNDSIVRFITVGNLLPIKGYDILIEAMYHGRLPEGGWSLDIIGEGPERDILTSRIKQYHLEKNIHLHGRMDRQSIVERLNKSDVYILSSRLETFGVAAIEALACGLPVIATECGGPMEFVNTTNAITCPPDNVERMAESINYMYHNYRHYDRSKIADDCQNRFSAEAIGKQLEQIFKDILKNHNKQ